MELYQAEHRDLSEKLSDMGAELVAFTLLYVLLGAVCLVWGLRSLHQTGIDDLLVSWSGIAWSVAGIALLVVAVGLWRRSKWTTSLAMSVHGPMAVFGLLGLRGAIHTARSDPSAFQVTLWSSVGMAFVSVLFMCWWKRDEVRAWTRAPDEVD